MLATLSTGSALETLTEHMHATAQQLYQHIIDYEMTQAWRPWNQAQPVGTTCIIVPQDLLDSPTPCVPDLMRLYQTLITITKKLDKAVVTEQIQQIVDEVFADFTP